MKNQSADNESLSLVNMVLLALVAWFCLQVAIYYPGVSSARRYANQRACYANMKTIAGALEMYNLDNPIIQYSFKTGKKEELEWSLESSDTLEDPNVVTYGTLVKKGYLEKLPNHPGTNEEPQQVYHFGENGQMYCKCKTKSDDKTAHGYIQNPNENSASKK